MAITNQERVGKAMDLLRAGLAPFVEREVQSAVKAGSVRMDAARRFVDDPILGNKPIAQWDVAGLLKLMWETWNDVFRTTRPSRARPCGRASRSSQQMGASGAILQR
jgi:Swt1-like HEPN